MTPSLLRRCAALAAIVCWTFVAPASPQPITAPFGVSGSKPSVANTETPAFGHADSGRTGRKSQDDTLSRHAAIHLVSASPELDAAEQTADLVVHPWRRLLKREVTPGVVANAHAIIRTHSVIGDEVPFTVAGERFLARIEEHYHPPGGDKFPWGPHPGVSVFVARPQPAR